MTEAAGAKGQLAWPGRVLRWVQRWVQRHWRGALLNVGLVLGVVLAVQAWQTRHLPSGPAPQLVATVRGPDGSPQANSLAEWRAMHPGQPVAISIWAEWCPYCRVEQDSLTRVGQDWPVLHLIHRSGPEAQVQRLMQQRQLPWHTMTDADGQLAKAWGLSVVPAFIVLDAHGHIHSAATGYTTELGMRARLWWAAWSR